LLVAEVEYDLQQNGVLQEAERVPWIFEQLGAEMIKAAQRRR